MALARCGPGKRAFILRDFLQPFVILPRGLTSWDLASLSSERLTHVERSLEFLWSVNLLVCCLWREPNTFPTHTFPAENSTWSGLSQVKLLQLFSI